MTEDSLSASNARHVSSPKSSLDLVTVGIGLSGLLAASFVLCVALGLVWSDGALHKPWFQFLPGVQWLSFGSFILGLVESIAYGWFIAVVYVPLYNVAARWRSTR